MKLEVRETDIHENYGEGWALIFGASTLFLPHFSDSLEGRPKRKQSVLVIDLTPHPILKIIDVIACYR